MITSTTSKGYGRYCALIADCWQMSSNLNDLYDAQARHFKKNHRSNYEQFYVRHWEGMFRNTTSLWSEIKADIPGSLIQDQTRWGEGPHIFFREFEVLRNYGWMCFKFTFNEDLTIRDQTVFRVLSKSCSEHLALGLSIPNQITLRSHQTQYKKINKRK